MTSSFIKSKKAVLIVCHAWHEEHLGGAFKLAAEFGQYLAGREYDVHFICGTDQPIITNPSEEWGMKVWRYLFPKAPSPSPLNFWSHYMRTRSLAKKIISHYPVHYLNGHSPLQFFAACSALKGNHFRRSYGVHSPFAEELKSQWGKEYGNEYHQQGFSLKQGIALYVAKFIERQIYNQATVIQCDSHYSLSVISRHYPVQVGSKGVVCPGWVDLKRFQPTEDRNELRKKLGAPWKERVVTFFTVRRLERRMGLDNLVKACAICASQGGRFRMIIGGTGPLYEILKDDIIKYKLEQIVFLTGRISDEALPSFYAASDCFILPTRALECFGLIILEAFACQTPAIATPVGSISEVMGEYSKQGWLTRDTSAEAIAESMESFLENRLYTQRQQLRDHVEPYGKDRILARLEGVVTGI